MTELYLNGMRFVFDEKLGDNEWYLIPPERGSTMTAKIINIFDHLSDEKKAERDAVIRAFERPLPLPDGDRGRGMEFLANWFLQGLWLEGFKVVRCDNPDDGNA